MVIVGKLFQWSLNMDLEDNDTSGRLEVFIIIFFSVVIGKWVKFWSYHISVDLGNKHNKAL